jgi:hypothetical protein
MKELIINPLGEDKRGGVKIPTVELEFDHLWAPLPCAGRHIQMCVVHVAAGSHARSEYIKCAVPLLNLLPPPKC